MTTRILPPSEWSKLPQDFCGGALPDSSRVALVVIEDDAGEVIGIWPLTWALLGNGVWIHPDHRGKASVARRLIDASLAETARKGIGNLLVMGDSPDVMSWLERLGGQRCGELFAVPSRG